MDGSEIDIAISKLMHPSIFTGVKPIVLVAEELVTQKSVGTISEAVWIAIDSKEDFSYINKVAVLGKINLRKYYQQSEIEPFCGRVALAQKNNLTNAALHKKALEDIKELESKRSTLFGEIHWGFKDFLDLDIENQEVYLFKKKDGNWEEEFFCDFDINTPYRLRKVVEKSPKLKLLLQNSRTQKTKEYYVEDTFYGYFIGSKAHIAGLKLKSESYLKSIISLQNQARDAIKAIQWLDLDHSSIKDIAIKLPKYPFEEYFNYVKKENVRKVNVSDKVLKVLKAIILKHMPENDTPMGMEYISIDKLLHLFHVIIPRAEALLALESCDIVYEPPAILLGYEGKRQSSPKYLVPISHVANAYKQFEAFIDLLEVNS